MAFLCPSGLSGYRRRRRAKLQSTKVDKSEQEKLTDGEVSEFEPTKMVVVRDFTPCVDDELEVKRGEKVKALYQENEWRYVVSENGKEGFIPYTYCVPLSEVNEHKGRLTTSMTTTSLQYELVKGKDIYGSLNKIDNLSQQEFIKRNYGRYIVLFDYKAVEEDDISANHGESVIVLNKDDKDWYWVKRNNGREGFIPRQYLQYIKENSETEVKESSNQYSKQTAVQEKPTFLQNEENRAFQVKKLVVIHEYLSQSEHELTIRKGEELFTDDRNIGVWLWVYSRKSRKSGFVPSSCVRWSQNTTFL